MKLNTFFKLLSGVIGVATFVPLILMILNGNQGASFAAFAFWTLIAGINTVVTIKEKGNYAFPLALTLGNLGVSIALFITRQFTWGFIEWVTLALVLICAYVWVKSSNSLTLIVSTLAITISGIPQLVLAWVNPTAISIPIWLGFLAASTCGIIAGKEWTIKERLYPVARFILYALIILIALKPF